MVYLPPGYQTSGRRYPVLYINDGQIAFDGNSSIHVNRICEDLIRRGEIEPIIAVAIPIGGDSSRFLDYSPWPDPYRAHWPPGGGGDFYLRAIRDTLKPEIDRRYRTLTDRHNTAITGYSLGGLISAYAGFAYDSTFGKVGASSPSYWWAWPRMFDLADSLASRRRGPIRFYQDTGYPYDNDIDEMEEVLGRYGYLIGVNFMSVTVPDASHSGAAWQNRFPGMLRFLFPREPS